MSARKPDVSGSVCTSPSTMPSGTGDHALLPIVVRAFKITSVAVFVWFWGYIGLSIAWIYVFLCFYVAGNEFRKIKESKKAYAHHAILNEKEAVLSRIDDHLSWVYFPDVERAEWLNKVLKQMWPYIDEYVRDLLKSNIEQSIQQALPTSFNSFKFEKIDLGDTPLRVEGIKVYTDIVQKDEIVCDLDVRYTGDAKIKISVNNVSAGIKGIHISGTMRVIMKPLVEEVPIIGGMSVFFLNRPSVLFDLTDAANLLDMPLLNKSLRSVVEEQVAYYLVLPNRIPIQLVDRVDISTLKYPVPQGVIHLEVVEARDLRGADSRLFGSATSDPYCVITVGANVLKTKPVKKKLDPVWNQHFEIIVDQKYGQSIAMEVKDADVTGTDDSLGMTRFDVETVAKKGEVDMWQQLEDVDTGSVHIRAKWLKLSKDLSDLKWVKNGTSFAEENSSSSAVLIVFLDKATNIPVGTNSKLDRNPFLRLAVGKQTRQSAVLSRNSNPTWNECFQFLVADPQKENVTLELYHRGSNDRKLGSSTLPINLLFTCENLTDMKTLAMPDVADNCSITIRLTLRIMMLPEGGLQNESRELQTPLPAKVDAPNAQLIVRDAAPRDKVAADARASQPLNTVQEITEKKLTKESSSPKLLPVSRSASSVTARSKDKKPTESMPENSNLLPRSPSNIALGQIQLTVRFSVQRNHLFVVVHQCRNLIPCDRDNLADPYVRIYIHPDHSNATKKKTKAVKDSLNPKFDETFEWPLNLADFPSHSLDVAVKNDVGLFSKSRSDMGHVVIPLSSFSDPTQAKTEWYDLKESSS